MEPGHLDKGGGTHVVTLKYSPNVDMIESKAQHSTKFDLIEIELGNDMRGMTFSLFT